MFCFLSEITVYKDSSRRVLMQIFLHVLQMHIGPKLLHKQISNTEGTNEGIGTHFSGTS